MVTCEGDNLEINRSISNDLENLREGLCYHSLNPPAYIRPSQPPTFIILPSTYTVYNKGPSPKTTFLIYKRLTITQSTSYSRYKVSKLPKKATNTTTRHASIYAQNRSNDQTRNHQPIPLYYFDVQKLYQIKNIIKNHTVLGHPTQDRSPLNPSPYLQHVFFSYHLNQT